MLAPPHTSTPTHALCLVRSCSAGQLKDAIGDLTQKRGALQDQVVQLEAEVGAPPAGCGHQN